MKELKNNYSDELKFNLKELLSYESPVMIIIDGKMDTGMNSIGISIINMIREKFIK